MIQVLLADDFAIIRVMLRHVLEKAGDMQVVAMASNGQEAVNEAAAHCPHIAVMDLSMPTMDGLEATRQIRLISPATRVLMVSMHRTPAHIHRSIDAGVFGYILKDEIPRELVTAVHTLHAGHFYFGTQVAELARLYMDREASTNTGRAHDGMERLKSNISLFFLVSMIFSQFVV